jgi:hypothetical protein
MAFLHFAFWGWTSAFPSYQLLLKTPDPLVALPIIDSAEVHINEERGRAHVNTTFSLGISQLNPSLSWTLPSKVWNSSIQQDAINFSVREEVRHSGTYSLHGPGVSPLWWRSGERIITEKN